MFVLELGRLGALAGYTAILLFAFILPAAVMLIVARRVYVAEAARSSQPTAPAFGGVLDVTKWGATSVWLLLIVTVLPFVYLVFAFFATALFLSSDPAPSPGNMPLGVTIVIFGYVVWVALTIALEFAYVLIALKSPISSTARLASIAMLVMLGGMAQPAGFYFLVWGPWRSVRSSQRPATGVAVQ